MRTLTRPTRLTPTAGSDGFTIEVRRGNPRAAHSTPAFPVGSGQVGHALTRRVTRSPEWRRSVTVTDSCTPACRPIPHRAQTPGGVSLTGLGCCRRRRNASELLGLVPEVHGMARLAWCDSSAQARFSAQSSRSNLPEADNPGVETREGRGSPRPESSAAGRGASRRGLPTGDRGSVQAGLACEVGFARIRRASGVGGSKSQDDRSSGRSTPTAPRRLVALVPAHAD